MIKIPVSKFNSEVLGIIFWFWNVFREISEASTICNMETGKPSQISTAMEVSWLAKPPLHRVLSRASRWKQLVIHTPEHVALWTARPARMIKSCREAVCVPCNWMQETASLIHRTFAHECYKWQPWGFSNDLSLITLLNPSKWMWCSTSWQSPAGRILQIQNRKKTCQLSFQGQLDAEYVWEGGWCLPSDHWKNHTSQTIDFRSIWIWSRLHASSCSSSLNQWPPDRFFRWLMPKFNANQRHL